jgi:predicted transposase YbfD/YdcC
MAGYHGWTHLKQVWLVEKYSSNDHGKTDIEQRFFLTNLHPGRLTHAQVLTLVRLHWGVENDAFWSLDMQWREDSVPWCSSGNAVEILSLMRLMAYNLVQLARKRSLRPRGPHGHRVPSAAWRHVLRSMRDALRLDIQPPFATAPS